MASDTDPPDDSKWLREQRARVEEYLAGERVQHGGVALEPDWYEPDVIAVWPVESAKKRGTIGWWAVSGDVPTDYVSATASMDARGALAAVAARWQAAAQRMARGEAPDGFTIGKPEQWPTLAPMLSSRADLIARWTADDELWS